MIIDLFFSASLISPSLRIISFLQGLRRHLDSGPFSEAALREVDQGSFLFDADREYANETVYRGC